MRLVSGLNQKGVSLVESLVAIAILAAIAIFIAQSNENFRPQVMGLKRTCQSHAQSVINAIQEETYYRNVVNFVPVGAVAAARQATGYTAADAPTRAVRNPPLANLWFSDPPAAYLISPANPVGPANDGVELQNFQLIQGTMRSLQTIYNNTAAVRCGFGAYAPLTDPAGQVPWPTELALNAGNNVQLRIQPYNRETGAAACPATVYPAPTGGAPLGLLGGDGINAGNNVLFSAFAPVLAGLPNVWVPPGLLPDAREAYDPGGGAPATRTMPVGMRMANRGVGSPLTADAGVASFGFEVTVQVNYTHEGLAQSCEVSQKFEYPVDRTPPRAPLVSVTRNDSYPPAPGGRPVCVGNIAAGVVQVEIRQPPGEEERGVQWLCRDLSWQKVWDLNNPPPYNQPPCLFPGGVVRPELPQYDDLLASQDFTLRNAQNFWVPCDRVTQCGQVPVAAYGPLGNPNDQNNQILTLTYVADNEFMRADGSRACVFNMEVVAVDTAGNTHIAGVNANRVFLEQVGFPADPLQPITRLPPNGTTPSGQTRVDRANEYLHPLCGEFCARNAFWVEANFPHGYWTCRGIGQAPSVNLLGRCCVDPPRGVPGDGICTSSN